MCKIYLTIDKINYIMAMKRMVGRIHAKSIAYAVHVVTRKFIMLNEGRAGVGS